MRRVILFRFFKVSASEDCAAITHRTGIKGGVGGKGRGTRAEDPGGFRASETRQGIRRFPHPGQVSGRPQDVHLARTAGATGQASL